jgi:superfamily II DNA or RNA helicase
MHQHVIQCDHAMAQRSGMLFAMEAETLSEQREARKASLDERVSKCAELVNTSKDQWLVWCDLNIESQALAKAIPDAVEITGSDSDEHKEKSILRFIDGEIRVLVTKPSLAGFGVNLQNCHNAAFVGLSHSFEQWHQATRRIWRFGQDHPVDSHIITSSADGAVVRNVERKREAFETMIRGMARHMADITRAEIGATEREFIGYTPGRKMTVPAWVGAEA